jgi:uncharacterized integral membrane protein (TIGR00698 family)
VAALALLAHALANPWPGMSPLVVGVGLGALVANVVPIPTDASPGVRFASRRLLRLGIVALGFRLAIDDVLEIGATGLVTVLAVVGVTFVGAQWLGRRLGVPPKLSLLVGTGYAICGATAIAAMEGVIDADEEETAYAVALVTLCGMLSIVVLPLLAGPLDLSGAAFGSWAGAAVHDVAQVVATAATDGPAALESAVVVKLTRVLLLAPLVAGVALWISRTVRPTGADARPSLGRTPPLPLFVVGFLVAVALRSVDAVPADALTTIRTVERWLLTSALVALGLGVRFDRLRRLGGRPLALGLVTWVLVAGVAYVGVRATT